MTPEKEEKLVKREMQPGGWKKLSKHEQSVLIPTKSDSSAEFVQNGLHGFQFKHLGELERRFARACEELPEGDVALWGDGYGRVSVDAFRRNNKLRVFYNDLDSRNSTPLKNFKNLCVKKEDQEKLIITNSSCLDLPESQAFREFFSDHNPSGKFSDTFGANFLHFMPPENVVKYMGLQYDLLTPGGKTFIVATTTHIPAEDFQYVKGLSQEKLCHQLTQQNLKEMNYIRNVISHQLREHWKAQGLSFYGYLNSEFFRNSSSLMPGHSYLLTNILFKDREVNFLPPETLTSIATAIGFEIEFTNRFALMSDGIKENPEKSDEGLYGGYIFRKPLNAPQPTDEGYFRNMKGFQDLEKRAFDEPGIIRELCEKRLSFKPEYPFFIIVEK